MVKTYNFLKRLESLNGQFHIAPAKFDSSSVFFEYIEGLSAERALIESILGGNIENAQKIIDKLMLFIDSLPSKEVTPINNKEYFSVFGKSFRGKQDCTVIGIVDLNLDNFIIREDGSWGLIDYEWCFDFPIPKKLLIQRFFWWFMIRHRESLLYHSKKMNCIDLGSNLFVPRFIFDLYHQYLVNFDDLQKAENNFQNYVKADRKSQVAVELLKTPTQHKASSLGLNLLVEKLTKANQTIPKLQTENSDLRKQTSRLEHEIRLIHNSRAYKAATKISRIKKIFND